MLRRTKVADPTPSASASPRPSRRRFPERPDVVWVAIALLVATLCAIAFSPYGERGSTAPAPRLGPAVQEPPPPSEGVAAPLVQLRSRQELSVSSAAAPERPSSPRAPIDGGRAETGAPVGRNTEADACVVEVQVRDGSSQRPIPDAAVEALFEPADDAGAVSRLHRSGPTGRLSLELTPGALRLIAWADGGAAEAVELRLVAGSTEEVTLFIEPRPAIEGRVVDQWSGEPVPGARVRIWTFSELDAVETDAEGFFRHPRFPAGEAAHQVRVDRPGYGPSVRYLVVHPGGTWELLAATAGERDVTGAGTPWIEVALVPELRLSGRVVAPSQRPIEGAGVTAEGYYHALPEVATPDRMRTETGPQGCFLLAGLRADIGHSLVLSAPGRAALSIEVASGTRELDLGTLVLEDERLLAGTVVDPEGQPVEDILVQLEELAPDEDGAPIPPGAGLDTGARLEGRLRSLRTGPEGVFLFEGLPPRRFELRVLRDRGSLLARTVDLEGAPPREDLLLELPLDSRTLVGEVRDEVGAVPGAEVEVRRFGPVARVRTDSAGRFRVAGLDDRAGYELLASAPPRSGGPPRTARAKAWSSETPILRIEER